MTQRTQLQLQILDFVSREGPVSSKQIQQVTGISQASVSRAIADLGSEISVFGSARSTTYAIHQSIHGKPGNQPIFNVDEHGRVSEVGRLDFLAADKVRVELGNYTEVVKEDLPWFLSPLRLEGFLGRLQARRFADDNWDTNPERWVIGQVLATALSLYDIPGSLILGDTSKDSVLPDIPALNDPSLMEALNREAEAIIDALPVGSSAGGEQPKFLARQGSKSVIVKFSPPVATPYGRRWSDLLFCEAIASDVLRRSGFQAAVNHTVETDERAFLISERFDRTEGFGRRHVVSLGAAHKGLVNESYQNWGVTAEKLAQRKALSRHDAKAAQTILEFGRLIGNTDMHSGNLAFYVNLGNLKRGLSLAPAYDMLPMRWSPNVQQQYLTEYTPFHLDERSLGGDAAPMAMDFWLSVSVQGKISLPLRQVAKVMADKVAEALDPEKSVSRPGI